MGNRSSRTLSPEQVNALQDETGFSPYQIDYLYNYYKSLFRDDNGKILRSELMRMPQIIIHPMGERIVDTYLYPAADFNQFLYGLAHFLIVDPCKNYNPNTRYEKLKVIFRMYDDDEDGTLSVEECKSLLPFFSKSQNEREILERRMNLQLASKDPGDSQFGKISLDDWFTILSTVEFDDFLAINF